jgi:hypothetical protein
MTKLTVTIDLELHELKKAYARFHGEKDWRKVRKADIAVWLGSLAEADIEGDLDDAYDDPSGPHAMGPGH